MQRLLSIPAEIHHSPINECLSSLPNFGTVVMKRLISWSRGYFQPLLRSITACLSPLPNFGPGEMKGLISWCRGYFQPLLRSITAPLMNVFLRCLIFSLGLMRCLQNNLSRRQLRIIQSLQVECSYSQRLLYCSVLCDCSLHDYVWDEHH